MNTYEDSIEDRAALDSLHARIAGALAPVGPPAMRLPGMRDRLGSRIADSIARHRGVSTLRRGDARWQPVGSGVRAWVLHDNGSSRTALLELAPGASVPGHRHTAHEECLMLRGSLDAGDCHVSLHDYHIAPAGSRHTGLSSTEGGVAFVRGSSVGSPLAMLREYLAGWLPDNDEKPYTVAAASGTWRAVAAGVQVKTLWQLGGEASLLVRLDAGAHLPALRNTAARECMMVNGEAFFGDILLREGEFQVSPAGRPHGAAYSDTGALLFMHADAAYAGD